MYVMRDFASKIQISNGFLQIPCFENKAENLNFEASAIIHTIIYGSNPKKLRQHMFFFRQIDNVEK